MTLARYDLYHPGSVPMIPDPVELIDDHGEFLVYSGGSRDFSASGSDSSTSLLQSVRTDVTLTTEKSSAQQQHLRIPRRYSSQMVSGVGVASSSAAKGIVVVELSSSWGHRVCEAEAIIRPRLTVYVPRAVPYREWSVLEGMQLAEPEFSSTRGIDMILGVDVYSQIIQPGLRRETLDQLIAQQTSSGWILSEKVTIPRLELMGASLLSRHMVSVCKALEIDDLVVNLWTDSSVALTWIKSDPARYKQFVKNRVSEIQRLMPQANWTHVPGEDNPADLVSRGVSSKKLVSSQLWWTGPRWLSQSESCWPEQRFAVNDSESLERKNVDVHAACVGAGSEYQSWDLVGRYNSLRELLAPSEIDEARVFWIRETQAEYFYQDVKKLRETKFQKSSLEGDFKHPVILPSSSKFTELVLMEAHRQTFHGGVQVMQTLLRRKYRILGETRPVKSFIFRCVISTRHRGTVAKQLMAVHIEWVTDYSMEGFLAFYRRFSARRGICETITSDRGTNLVGADRELRRLFDATGREAREIAQSVSKDGTKWIFDPPRVPHHGGKSEAAVKSAKFHLKHVIGEATLTYEELTTLLT
ncbi:uncharacterized protein LOC107041862 [Diachasma alloeum]|uniref:uncharacterized protein LOC107041862 n=1 Tax=Diachasma alloeum TaxID=454923 RepID=UPI0007383EEC|nr:uncharacterized protein LOC107041862 [Diachasma alloeum]